MTQQTPGKDLAAAPRPDAPRPGDNGKASYHRLPGSRLEIPPGAQLTLGCADSDRTFAAEFVGNCGRDCLLARFPDQDGAREALPPRAAVTVRFLHPDYNLCGFTTAVAGVVMEPLPLLVLDYPAAAGVLDLRRQERVNCFLPSRVFCDDGANQALITSLSPDGCRLVAEAADWAAPARYRVGASLACNFRLFDFLDELFVPGLVRHAQARSDRVCLGVQFAAMVPGDRAKVADYVRQVLAVAAAG